MNVRRPDAGTIASVVAFVVAIVVVFALPQLVSDFRLQEFAYVAIYFIALVGLIVLTRKLGLSNRAALGYGLPRADFVRQLGLGWAAGIGLMLPLVALLLAFDVRQIKPGLDGDLPLLLLGGFAVGALAAGWWEQRHYLERRYDDLSPRLQFADAVRWARDLRDAAVVMAGDRIVWVGPARQAPTLCRRETPTALQDPWRHAPSSPALRRAEIFPGSVRGRFCRDRRDKEAR